LASCHPQMLPSSSSAGGSSASACKEEPPGSPKAASAEVSDAGSPAAAATASSKAKILNDIADEMLDRLPKWIDNYVLKRKVNNVKGTAELKSVLIHLHTKSGVHLVQQVLSDQWERELEMMVELCGNLAAAKIVTRPEAHKEKEKLFQVYFPGRKMVKLVALRKTAKAAMKPEPANESDSDEQPLTSLLSHKVAQKKPAPAPLKPKKEEEPNLKKVADATPVKRQRRGSCSSSSSSASSGKEKKRSKAKKEKKVKKERKEGKEKKDKKAKKKEVQGAGISKRKREVGAEAIRMSTALKVEPAPGRHGSLFQPPQAAVNSGAQRASLKVEPPPPPPPAPRRQASLFQPEEPHRQPPQRTERNWKVSQLAMRNRSAALNRGGLRASNHQDGLRLDRKAWDSLSKLKSEDREKLLRRLRSKMANNEVRNPSGWIGQAAKNILSGQDRDASHPYQDVAGQYQGAAPSPPRARSGYVTPNVCVQDGIFTPCAGLASPPFRGVTGTPYVSMPTTPQAALPQPGAPLTPTVERR